jgi:hypothetical protein
VFQSTGSKRAEGYVGLLGALLGALVGGMLGLAGVYWQTQDSERHMQREAVEVFLNDYGEAFVELEYFGNRRVPVAALSKEDKEALRKHVHGVYGACSRLALVAPDLAKNATTVRDILANWGQAITDIDPYGRIQQDEFIKTFDVSIADFIEYSRSSVGLT